MSFSVTNAAFEGFRLTREHPRAVLLWTGALLLLHLATSVLLVGMAGPALNDFAAMDPTDPDPDAMLAALEVIGPPAMLSGLISLAVYGVIFAAVTRAVLEPARAAFGYLRLGRAEALQFLVLLTLWLLSLAAFFVLALVTSPFAAAVGPAVIQLGAAAVVFALWGRFLLAGPATFDRGRFSLATGWAAGKGRWRPMISALLLASALATVVAVLCMVVFIGLAAAALGGVEAADAAMAPDFSSLSAYFTPVRFAWTAFVSLVSALVLTIVGAVGARAWQAVGRPG